jgi:CheY-like chemotaxis protein
MTKIMLVEDDKAIQKAMSMRLRVAGYEPVGVLDPRSAIAVALRERPALILLDISMPNIDGFQLAVHLKAEPSLHAIPLIFVTASRRPGFRERAQNVGAVGYLEKPFEPEALLEAIRIALA